MSKRFATVLAVCTLLAASVAMAGPEGPTWQFTPLVGYTWFDDDVSPRAENNLYFGARIGHQRGRVGLSLAAGLTATEWTARDGYWATESISSADFVEIAGDVSYALLEGSHADAFVLAGVGVGKYLGDFESGVFPALGPTPANLDEEFGTLVAGAGTRVWLSPNVAIRTELRHLFTVTQAGGNHWIASGGLTFAIGGPPADSDADGVPDRRDQCPGTPQGARVDVLGCPSDSDGDAVYDGMDRCEGTPRGARVDIHGCPSDADADGVLDGLDRCANTPRGALVDADGCPSDADADAVLDGIDACPNTPRGAAVDARGCPADGDGDGVSDGLDQCPNTPAGLRVDVSGCPIEITERETEFLDTGLIRLQGIQFETGKADILPASTSDLDVVGAILQKWPQLRIEVGGHTDARGTAASNQALSEARARAVVEWLTSRNPALQASQFTARGYGEGTPIATNGTAAGRAINRRVEFKVLNRDVLRREIERRRLVPKD